MFSNFNKALPDVFLTLTAELKVETPATLTLSKFVWPSTSISPLISKAPATAVPAIVTPVFVVVNFVEPLNDKTTSPWCTATIAFSLEVAPPALIIISPPLWDA